MQESQTVSDTHRSFASSGESGPRHEVSSCCIGICSAEWLECRCDLPFCAGIRPQPPGIPVVCDRFGCLNQKTTASFVSLPRDVSCAFCVSLPAMAGEAVSVPPFPPTRQSAHGPVLFLVVATSTSKQDLPIRRG